MVLSAGPKSHVFFLIVKPVIAGLGASDQLRKRIVLKRER